MLPIDQIKKGGGVSVLINEELKSQEIPLKDICTPTEAKLVEIKLEERRLIVGSMYRPPNSKGSDFITNFEKIMKTLKLTKKTDVIIGLDHNPDFLKSSKHKKMSLFINRIFDHGLLPCITRPTRITHTSASLIDNVLVSGKLHDKCLSGIAISDLSDHLPCLVTLNDIHKTKSKHLTIEKRDISSMNLRQVSSDLNIDWPAFFQATSDVNDGFDKFHRTINESIENRCPTKKIKISSKKIIKEPWLTKGIINSSKKQLCLYKQSLTKRSEVDCVRYKQYQDCLKKIKRDCKRLYFSQQCERHKHNTKKLWETINTMIGKLVNKTSVIDFITVDNIKKFTAMEISNEFAKFYATIGKKLEDNIPSSTMGLGYYLNKISRNKNSIFLYPTNSLELSKIIRKLKSKTSSGYDGISNTIIKELETALLLPLEIIINMSLQTGIFPERMNVDVVPLFKGGDEHILGNYRPISLLLALSKILEKVIYARVYNFLNDTNQIFKSQYGFRSKHSCEHAMSELVGNILKGLETNKSTICIYLDLSKAFDTLEHSTLFRKMERYGIRGVALDWFKSYLANRTLRVKCTTQNSTENTTSNSHNVTYGTPQGSCLGPLIFLIFCNDLYLNLVHSSCILFADDTTLFASGNDERLLVCSLEHDLTIISDWFKANKLTLNKNKTVCMLFNSKNKMKNNPSISIDGEAIPFVDHTKFLGVWIDNKLNWKEHTERLLIKLKQNSHLLYQSKNFLTPHAKKIIYYAQIYSHLMYGLSIWGNMTT